MREPLSGEGGRLTETALADQILKLLPEDGTPVLNRVMRTMLARENQREIDPSVYFAALDKLSAANRIGRLRGQGGQLFALSETPAAPPPPTAQEEWAEQALMAPLGAYLGAEFREGLDLPKDAKWIVQDTSALGPKHGQWARPDFILVTAMRFKLLPGSQVDVHSFELKTESGGSVQAVHEALAQTRFTHFGHLVWHLPDGSRAEARLAEIAKHCGDHGIGLIRMRKPDRRESFEILIDPVRKATPAIAIDGFLESRLSPDHRETLTRLVRGEVK
jgi:hypothetical protein